MDKEAFFRRAVRALKENATYSQHDDSWTIGIPQLRMIMADLLKQQPEEMLPSYILILEEGMRRGFWKIDYDHEYVTDIVVIRQLDDHK